MFSSTKWPCLLEVRWLLFLAALGHRNELKQKPPLEILWQYACRSLQGKSKRWNSHVQYSPLYKPITPASPHQGDENCCHLHDGADLLPKDTFSRVLKSFHSLNTLNYDSIRIRIWWGNQDLRPDRAPVRLPIPIGIYKLVLQTRYLAPFKGSKATKSPGRAYKTIWYFKTISSTFEKHLEWSRFGHQLSSADNMFTSRTTKDYVPPRKTDD